MILLIVVFAIILIACIISAIGCKSNYEDEEIRRKYDL